MFILLHVFVLVFVFNQLQRLACMWLYLCSLFMYVIPLLFMTKTLLSRRHFVCSDAFTNTFLSDPCWTFTHQYGLSIKINEIWKSYLTCSTWTPSVTVLSSQSVIGFFSLCFFLFQMGTLLHLPLFLSLLYLVESDIAKSSSSARQIWYTISWDIVLMIRVCN